MQDKKEIPTAAIMETLENIKDTRLKLAANFAVANKRLNELEEKYLSMLRI
jgi:hypothetical protein